MAGWRHPLRMVALLAWIDGKRLLFSPAHTHTRTSTQSGEVKIKQTSPGRVPPRFQNLPPPEVEARKLATFCLNVVCQTVSVQFSPRADGFILFRFHPRLCPHRSSLSVLFCKTFLPRALHALVLWAVFCSTLDAFADSFFFVVVAVRSQLQ